MSSTELICPVEELNFLKVRQDVTRQNIGCLLVVLNSCVKTGAEYGNSVEYTLDDVIDRGLVRNKLMNLIGQLQ